MLEDLPGGLLSVSGTASDDVYTVGADAQDGLGAQVLHYDGTRWTRLRAGVTGDLWWITDRQVGDSFFMVGAGGLALRYRPATSDFELYPTVGTETLFGVWGSSPNNVIAVGGDQTNPDVSGVIYRFDGTTWTADDLTAINPDGVPVLFKVWGRSDNDVYVVGGRGTILHYDGTSWTQLASPTTRTLFTVHGNDTVVVACGGAQSAVIVESTGGAFTDVTPAGALQMNGTFVSPGGDAITVGLEGAIALRTAGAWSSDDTGLDLDPRLDYHAAWADPDGGIWAVGGNILGEPRTQGLVAHFGTEDVGTEIVTE